ncbi:MAG TPA: hypothetical protein VNQ76_14250 [Planctomicrobium sp.]|nr:hypothetical protein [Planctomicrobium sp.]
MTIDWFTLIAQIINFLVLVWLLRHFLYDRIIQAMDDREKKIADQLNDAARVRQEAQAEKQKYQTNLKELEENREEKLAEARSEADAYRQNLIEKAHQKADEAQSQWVDSLKREQNDLLQEFRERLGEQVFSVTRHALKELADAELEQKILSVFLERLDTLEENEQQAIQTALSRSGHKAEVRTAFPVSEEGREQLTRALHLHLQENFDIQFHLVPDLICGIELRAQSQRLVWNLDSYLTGLEDRVFQALEESALKYAQSR